MSDTKSAKATIAAGILDEQILEMFLIKGLPKSNRLCLKSVKKETSFNYYSLRKHLNTDLYNVSRKFIHITTDEQLLSTKAKEYAERLIKKQIFPAKYKNNELIYYTMKLFDSSYFSEEEKAFIDLMSNELNSIISYDDFSTTIHPKEVFEFNLVNDNSFYQNARTVFNDILQKKLHAGDSILSYFDTEHLTAFEMAKRLYNAEKYDFFFNRFGILNCDLDTNKDILIKNFLNTVLYSFRNITARFVLLLNLNTKYPFLLSVKNGK